jgi:hypothetical protein
VALNTKTIVPMMAGDPIDRFVPICMATTRVEAAKLLRGARQLLCGLLKDIYRAYAIGCGSAVDGRLISRDLLECPCVVRQRGHCFREANYSFVELISWVHAYPLWSFPKR